MGKTSAGTMEKPGKMDASFKASKKKKGMPNPPCKKG